VSATVILLREVAVASRSRNVHEVHESGDEAKTKLLTHETKLRQWDASRCQDRGYIPGW